MSLFGNIFKSGEESKGGSLFSEENKFKAHGDAQGAASKKAGGKSKRPAVDAFGAPRLSKYNKQDREVLKGLKQQRMERIRKGKDAKGAKAREQAGKVADAAADARRLAAAEGGDAAEQPPKAKKQKLSKTEKKAVKKAAKVDKKKQKVVEQVKAQSEEEEEAEEGAELVPKAAKGAGKEKKEEKKSKQAKKEESSDDESESESDSESDGEEEEGEEAADKDADARAKLARTIFVGNLPKEAKKKGLTALFGKYGKVESIRLRSVPLVKDTAIPRKAAVASGAVDLSRGSFHAYVVFQEESAARAALSHNMEEWLGNHLRVDMAGTSTLKKFKSKSDKEKVDASEGTEVQYDPSLSIFIGNIPTGASDEELIRFFISGVGAGGEKDLEAVRIVRDPHTSIGKGVGFALFKTKNGRRAALGLDGRKLRNRPLRITPIKAGASIGTGRLKAEKGAAAWQGVTATKSGRVKGPGDTVASPNGRGRSDKASKGGKRAGKRPAVEARKQKQLGIPVSGGVKKKKPSLKGKKKPYEK